MTAYDKKSLEELGEFGKEFSEKGVRFVLGEGYLDDLKGDLIFKTPGMRYDLPQLLRAQEFLEENGCIEAMTHRFLLVAKR